MSPRNVLLARSTLLLLLALCTPGLARAQSSDEVSVVALEGHRDPTGATTLGLRPGPVATHAIAVYSEPSHTLLTLVVDEAYAASPAGLSWLDGVHADEALARVTTSLPAAQPRVVVGGRPEGDRRIAVEVYGTWPDGSVEERLVADTPTPGDEFAFQTFVSADGSFHHCCSGEHCSQKCTDCPGPRFSCCLLEGCCSIACGWGDPASCTCAECIC